MSVNLRRLGHRAEIFAGDFLHVFARDFNRLVDALDTHAANQLGVFLHKRLHCVAFGRLTDGIRHVDGEKIGAVEILVDRVHIDVVGIHVPTPLPAQRLHGGLGGIENALGFGTDKAVFAI